jgi:hypothetical protein
VVEHHLGLPPATPRVRLQRSNPGGLHDLLANVDEVAEHLDGTPYAWMTSS